ncbi:unnamed protein product [Danaus chrysippus]|uniref:(African queen) hypothetical protein n=1 Tax=Danaus chrysippus TaxID=151541 RepID=A0A8J2WFE9_9NEOP|nr:unnamed protein product [Danaus chrysippus]
MSRLGVEGGPRAPVHRTKGQLQITQSGARQSTSRCTPANRRPPLRTPLPAGTPAPHPPAPYPLGTRIRPP